MANVLGSSRFLNPREAFAVAPVRATILYLGYGVLLLSFFFPWTVYRFGNETITTYAFGTGFGVPFWAFPFMLGLTVYGILAPFAKVSPEFTRNTVRAYSFVLGAAFSGWGYGNVLNNDPRLGSYLAIAGGLAIASVNVYDLLTDGRLSGIVSEQRDKDEELPSDHPWSE